MKSFLKEKLSKAKEFLIYSFSSNSKKNVFTAKVDIYTGVYYVHGIYPLKDSFFGRHKILYLVPNKEKILIQENDFFCTLNHGPWDNYYHWFIDSVPRIWTLIENNFLPGLKIYVCNTIPNEWIEAFHKILPSNFRIIIVNKGTYVYGEKAVFLPFLSSDCSGKLPSGFLDFFIKSTSNLYDLDLSVEPFIKLYISRKKAFKRKLTNENKIVEYLSSKGFVICQLEDMSIKEQADLFFNAKLIVAQHGAGLTNLLYTRKATVVEIFQSKNNHLNHYQDLARQKILRYHPLYLNGQNKNDDTTLDITILGSILTNLETESDNKFY